MTLIFICQGVLFIILGIPLALNKIAPNGVYGFRTSKTLSDPKIWYAVNRASGIDLCIAGIIIIAGALLFKVMLKSYAPQVLVYANLALVIFALTAVVIHGFIVLRRF